MQKWLIILLALVGAAFLIAAYIPSLWAQGIAIQGYKVPYAPFLLGGVLLLGYRLKGK